ncbi:MAG: sugar phosphate isomerase/epimerase family protein [Planctomycetota bacterium]
MGKVLIGVNMEFVRHSDKSFAWGVAEAARIGYRYVEPMVHLGRELLSEAGYFHSVSMEEDPLEMKAICEAHGVLLSGLSAHCPLTKPEVSVRYLREAARYAAEAGAPVINTDEGVKPDFTDEETDFTLMGYTLTLAARAAERRGVKIGLECHQVYSSKPDGLDRIWGLVRSPAIGINFDTGNSYIAGQDPYSWLERVAKRLVHVHAKDISVRHSEEERGKVTGTPVGCACGDGVIDWERVVRILKPLPQDLVLSVECGEIEQAARSYEHLRRSVEKAG